MAGVCVTNADGQSRAVGEWAMWRRHGAGRASIHEGGSKSHTTTCAQRALLAAIAAACEWAAVRAVAASYCHTPKLGLKSGPEANRPQLDLFGPVRRDGVSLLA